MALPAQALSTPAGIGAGAGQCFSAAPERQPARPADPAREGDARIRQHQGIAAARNGAAAGKARDRCGAVRQLGNVERAIVGEAA